MPQVGIFGSAQEEYGANPTFSGMTLLNTARNLKTFWHYDDFVKGSDVQNFWRGGSTGAGSACWSASGSAVRPGQTYCGTGTTNAGYAYLSAGGLSRNAFIMGAGVYTWEVEMSIPNLSTALEEFAIYQGYGDIDNGDQSDGVYFRYDRPTNVNWLACTSGAGVRTVTDTGIPVTGAWTKFKIVAENARALFYIGDVLVATNTTNLPTVQTTGLIMTIVKSVGITDRTMIYDWAWVHIDLAVSR